MRLISCDIENFLSIEKAHVDFNETGLLLIEGWNYDVDRANGAGKTAVLNAISFGLYDKLPRKITASEIVRRGSKKGSVSIRLDIGGEIYGVQRSRPKGVTFSHEVNGTSEEIQITQEEWEAKLRLSYDQFIVAMYCSQGNSSGSPRFLLLNDTDKKQFILQLLNLDEFTLCKAVCDKNLTDLQIKFSAAQQRMAELQVKIDAYGESLIDEHACKLMIAQKEVSRLAFVKALTEAQAVEKPDLAKYLKLEEGVLAKKSEFVRMKTKREMLFAQWNQMGKKLKPFNAATSCSLCGSDLDNSHAEAMHNAELERIKQERQDIKLSIDELDTTLLGEAQVNDLHSKLKERKRKESAEAEQAAIAQVEANSRIRSIDIEIRELTKKLNDNAQLAVKVNGFKASREEASTHLLEIASEIELQKTVANIYSSTGAQAYVLDSAVALFNEHVAKYVDMLWPNLTYELQSYKENVKGEVTAKFSESIVMDGKPISLGSLSGGELKALSICADMALLNCLEQQFGIQTSPVIFDEAFDGLDASGKEFALELIRGLSNDRLVVVIDHASEMRASFDTILRVEKRNGVSAVSLQP
jgi:DNA repair exonuclease SbcCD ATPase subunit